MVEIGDSFCGFQVRSVLGKGGAGTVYRALQVQLKREVALKVVRVGASLGLSEKKRFLREAMALARLSHPRIIRIYDSGEHEDFLYYAMELVCLDTDAQLL